MTIQVSAAASTPVAQQSVKTSSNDQKDSFQSVLQATQGQKGKESDSGKTGKSGDKGPADSTKDKMPSGSADGVDGLQTAPAVVIPGSVVVQAAGSQNSTSVELAGTAIEPATDGLTGDGLPSQASLPTETAASADSASAQTAEIQSSTVAQDTGKARVPEDTLKNAGSRQEVPVANSKVQAAADSLPATGPDKTVQADSSTKASGFQPNSQVTAQPAKDSEQAAQLTAGVPGQKAENASVSSTNTEKQTGYAVVSSAEGQIQKDSKEPDTGAGQTAQLYSDGNVVIKVSDSAQKPAVSVPHQVAQSIAAQIPKGKQEFQVDLYPQSLGKVSVKMVSQDGLLTITLTAANAKTQSLLLSSSGEIRSMLQSSTGQPVTVTTPQQADQPSWYSQQQDGGNSGYQQQQQNQQENRNRQQFGDLDTGIQTSDFLSLLQQAGRAG